jgi:hypothetical protein
MILKAYDSIIQVEDNEWGGATFVVRFLKNAVGEVT